MIVPIKTRIPPENVTEAKALAAKILSMKKIKKTPNYTGISFVNRFEIGFCGEFHVKHFLQSRGIKHHHTPIASGKSEGTDILVYINGVSYRLEIKTAGSPDHKFLAFPKDQRIAKYVIGFVAVRLGGAWDEAEIMGYLPDTRFFHLRDLTIQGTRNMKGIEFALLDDIDRLLERLDKHDRE